MKRGQKNLPENFIKTYMPNYLNLPMPNLCLYFFFIKQTITILYVSQTNKNMIVIKKSLKFN